MVVRHEEVVRLRRARQGNPFCETGTVTAESAPSEVIGTVAAGPFAEGESVCFIFEVNGKLNAPTAEDVANQLVASQLW